MTLSSPRSTTLTLLAGAGLALVAALTAGCASAPTGTPAAKSADADAVRWARDRLPLEPCPIGDEATALCGNYAVYENRAAASGRRIDLRVIVLPARTPTPEPDPVFFFMGGPGGGAAATASFGVAPWDGVRQKRDVVMIDQRGTGASHLLQCELPGGPDEPSGYLSEMLPVDAVEVCRAELEEKADLTLYTTSIAMDDIDEVRRWLGYDRINLRGGSYGSRAAQIYLRRHPESVRSALLEGVVGMEQHLPLYHARDAQAALERILDACATDPDCATAFPDLRRELDAVVGRLDEAPAEVELPIPGGGVDRGTVSKEVFVEGLRFLLYGPATARTVPLLIHEAYEGDYDLAARLSIGWLAQIRQLLAFGMFLSVTCAEDLPFFGPEEAARETAGTYLGDYRIAQQKRACRLWPRAEIPEGFHRPVTADVPVLLLTGAYDPVTPPSWGEEVAAHLPDGHHFVVAEGHHGIGGLSNQECYEALVNGFLDQASIDGLDTACLASMQRPPFVTSRADVEAMLAGG